MEVTLTADLTDIDTLLLAIDAEVKSAVDAMTAAVVRRLKREVPRLVYELVQSSPEAASLKGGRLRGEMGLVDPDRAVAEISSAVAAAADIRQIPCVVRGGVVSSGGVDVGLLRSNMSDALSAELSSFVSEGKFRIPWLSWLLKGGDRVLVSEYQFYPGNYPNSRTGMGIMRTPRGRSKFSAGWSVPTEFSGTEGDNWLTRSLGKIIGPITTIVEEEVARAFR
jgi:hypothetical protein